MMQVNKLVESGNLKSAILLRNNFKPHFESLKKYAKISMAIDKFEESFLKDIQTKSLDFMLKNIRKVFEFLPKFGATLTFNLRNNAQVEKVQNAAMLELFSETVDLLKIIGNYDKLKVVFYEKFYEFLEISILKNIDSKNLGEKSVDLFCFFVIYQSFRAQIFHLEIPEMILLKTEPRFCEKMKVK